MGTSKSAIKLNEPVGTGIFEPDSIIAACSLLNHEWGTHGYRVLAISGPPSGNGTGSSCFLHVLASDGSRFWISVDRFGGNAKHGDYR